MQINKEIFFNEFRPWYKATTKRRTLAPDVAEAVDFLLDSFQADPEHWSKTEYIAYAFATISIETAYTYQPIEEYGKGKGHAYGKKNPETGQAYYGRGYVQLTWDENYEKAGREIGVDLINNASLALDPVIAFKVMTLGMTNGWFAKDKFGRPHTLKRHLGSGSVNYKEARRIINGTDKAALIAGYAIAFNNMLLKAVEAPAATTEAAAPVAIVGGRPEDTPIEVTQVVPEETTGWGTWITNIRTQWASLGLSGISLGSLSFLNNPIYIYIAIGIAAATILIAATVYLTSLYLKNKDKQAREQRAHELTLEQLRIAADPLKYNAVVTKPTTENK